MLWLRSKEAGWPFLPGRDFFSRKRIVINLLYDWLTRATKEQHQPHASLSKRRHQDNYKSHLGEYGVFTLTARGQGGQNMASRPDLGLSLSLYHHN